MLDQIVAKVAAGAQRFTDRWNARAKLSNRVAQLEDIGLLLSYRPNREQRRQAAKDSKVRCDINRHTRGARRTRQLMALAGSQTW